MRRIQAVSVSIGLSDIGYGTSISVLRSWPVPGSIESVSIFVIFFCMVNKYQWPIPTYRVLQFVTHWDFQKGRRIKVRLNKLICWHSSIYLNYFSSFHATFNFPNKFRWHGFDSRP
jgi:hypothetical protein